jgi:hypothetical protein
MLCAAEDRIRLHAGLGQGGRRPELRAFTARTAGENSPGWLAEFFEYEIMLFF